MIILYLTKLASSSSLERKSNLSHIGIKKSLKVWSRCIPYVHSLVTHTHTHTHTHTRYVFAWLFLWISSWMMEEISKVMQFRCVSIIFVYDEICEARVDLFGCVCFCLFVFLFYLTLCLGSSCQGLEGRWKGN